MSKEREKRVAVASLAFVAIGALYLLGVSTSEEASAWNKEATGVYRVIATSTPTPIYGGGELVDPQPAGVTIVETPEKFSRSDVYYALQAKKPGDIFIVVTDRGEELKITKTPSYSYQIIEGERAGNRIVMRNIVEVK